MTLEEKSQDKTNPPDFELSRDEEDQLEKVTIAPENNNSKCISIFCSACQQTIYPYHILHHKKNHKALTLLGFDSPQIKTDNKILLAQRQKLISKLTKIPKYSETHKQKIDYSFEFLMDNHTPTSYCDLANINNPSTLKKVNNSLIKALSICQDKNSTWQGHMEDRFIVLDNYGNRSDTCFLGLVDGSHGVTAAETVAAELPLLFLDQLAQTDSSYKKSEDEQQILDSFATVIKADYREKEKIFCDKPGNDKTNKTNTYEWIHKAYAKSFWRMDRLLRLGRNEVSKVRWSGCSVVTCLVERIHSEEADGIEEEERKHSRNTTHSPLARTAKGVAGLLHIANIGNAHAVLCKNGKTHCLSKEHSTSNVSERKRILQNGGHISTNEPDGLVEGYLRTTRGLGHHGDPVLKRSVIPVPHTISVPIDDTCQFLILASNGLWEVLDYNEVLALTLTTFTHYLRMYECVQQNGTSLCKCQYLMPLTEDNLNDSKATKDLQDGIEILYSNKDIFLTDSKGNLKQNKPKCSRRNYLQSEDGVPKETDDHKNQADPGLSLFTNNEVKSQYRDIKQADSSTQSGSEELKQFEDRKVYLCNNLQPQPQTAEQEETDTGNFCATGPSHTHKQLRENVLAIGSKDMKQPPKDTKACLSNYDSGPQLAEKMDSKIFCDKPASYAGQELLKTVSPVGSKPPPLFEEDTKTYPSNCESRTAGRGRVTSETLYNNAASYISEQLVKTALAAGSRDNITILIVLLNGCDKIPNYLNI
ncbi:PREDICTED: LOW QUALITY PROTEIN: protein phosphatase 2C-like domain-containing protein 1 [Fulmarus glacialis]|uniref:LOW QUALITY PROTEIN: protein phosphatase 2C-like domain-containing protein 1 n=1 Tax=Fulmarus glacialis TaxID=30455 RepID=UPI00051B2390|nr:PREDICTED: LOW QUALITY PROTEIN: protein phosphatase 2C-like domain-containing protein 1 [Fulmarus glacialis]